MFVAGGDFFVRDRSSRSPKPKKTFIRVKRTCQKYSRAHIIRAYIAFLGVRGPPTRGMTSGARRALHACRSCCARDTLSILQTASKCLQCDADGSRASRCGAVRRKPVKHSAAETFTYRSSAGGGARAEKTRFDIGSDVTRLVKLLVGLRQTPAAKGVQSGRSTVTMVGQ